MTTKNILLFSIIITLLVGAGIFVWWQGQPKEVEASPDPDWLLGYGYRKQITINGSTAGAQIDYQMKLTVHKGTGYCYGSDFLNSGTASADSEWSTGYVASYAFDNDTGKRWSSTNSAFPHWVKYDLGSGVTKTARKLRLKAFGSGTNCQVKDFKFQGSNNDADWSDILSVTSEAIDSWQKWTFSNPTAYRYYRIYITSSYYTGGNQVSIWEIELMEVADCAGDVYLNDHAQSWTGTVPNDIRFTNFNGDPLDYWIESSDANTATVWIEFDSIPTGGANFYIYYRKADATDLSDGDATFIFYEDFSGSLDPGKWTIVVTSGASVYTSGGILYVRQGGVNRQAYAQHAYGQTLTNFVFEFRTQGYNLGSIVNQMSNYGNTDIYNNNWAYWADAWYNITAFQSGWHTWKIIHESPANTIKWYYDDVYKRTRSGISGSSSFYFGGAVIYSVHNAQGDFDWVRVRKYVSPEPEWGTWGSETPAPAEPGVGSSYTAKVKVFRGSGMAIDTTEIIIVPAGVGICEPFVDTIDCTSPQGCSHTITCQSDGSWPACTSDYWGGGQPDVCVKDVEEKDCGNYCGTQTCDNNCQWGPCIGEGECPKNTLNCEECPCPPAQDCAASPNSDCNSSCMCEPCESVPCNQVPTCGSLTADFTSILVGQSVIFTGSSTDSDGNIIEFEFDFGDGTVESVTVPTPDSDVILDQAHTYATSGDFCAKLRVKDSDGAWSNNTGDCPGGTCTQEITVSPNQAPIADISCHPQGCEQPSGPCTGYTGSGFCLKNDSIDPDGIDDIANSIWTITGPPDETSPCFDPICDWTLPSHFTAGNYTAELYVEDYAGAWDTDTQLFTILQDAIADFMCSLDNETWQECETGTGQPTIRVSQGEIVYFKDDLGLLKHSSPSDGAGVVITNREWLFEDGTPVSLSGVGQTNPSVSFEAVDLGSGTVTLTITDSAVRTDTVSYQIVITLPLPKWKEIPPF